MVKIAKEGKEMNEKESALIMAGISNRAIKHHKCLFSSYSSRVIIIPMEWLGLAWLGSL
jgi:hypothetical protein